MNVGPVVATRSRGFELTNRLTGTTTLGLDALGAEISTSPMHCAGVVKVAVLICTLMVKGVAPVCCDSTIQLLPQLDVLAVAVKATLVPVLLVMERVVAGGALVPIW